MGRRNTTLRSMARNIAAAQSELVQQQLILNEELERIAAKALPNREGVWGWRRATCADKGKTYEVSWLDAVLMSVWVEGSSYQPVPVVKEE